MQQQLAVTKIHETEALVIGSGIAGLVSCFNLLQHGCQTVLTTDKKLAGGASFSSIKGSLGIQVTDNDAQDIELFKKDLTRIGVGMDNPELIDTYVQQSPKSIVELQNIGFKPWLRSDRRPACFADYPRDIYLINDWRQAKDNAKKIFNHPNLQLLEEHRLLTILTENKVAIGALFITATNDYLLIKSNNIVLACGGIGGLYQHSLYPAEVNGSGHLAALDAGAKLVNMEFIQFIPALVTPKYNTLFGEHTAKYCTKLVDEFNQDLLLHIPQEQQQSLWQEYSGYAPFSCDFPSHIIDLAIFKAISSGSQFAKMSFSEKLYHDTQEFYTLYLNWLESLGINMCRDEIGIAHFAHSCNGGIQISTEGETAVSGLYAVGEICSAIEGANRLGGNSVGGALVFAKRAADHIKHKKDKPLIGDELILSQFHHWYHKVINSDNNDSIRSPREISHQIQAILAASANIVRSHTQLQCALDQIDSLTKQFSIAEHQTYLGFNALSNLRMAKVLLSCMLERTESRGAHYREDFPQRDPSSYRIEISMSQNNDIELNKIFRS
ncbi:TPA: FAD-binding protein [Photobacterium damselae]